MARCSKKQKGAVISRRKRFFQRFFVKLQKSTFPMKATRLKKLHRLGDGYTNARGIWEKLGENNRCIGAKMTCCRWKIITWIYCKLSALSAKLCKALQPVAPPDHQVRIFWEALTPYFLGQGINYRTVANQFGVAVPTVCLIVHEETKAIGDNLNPECVKFS